MRRLLGGIGVACLGVGGYAYMGYSVDAYAYTHPLLKKLLDPEDLHRLAVLVAAQPRILRSFLGLVDSRPDDSILKTNAFGMEFSNPIGLAAGFDKHAECMEGMIDLGFGFVEVGSITPNPQDGNPRPRVWRLDSENAVMNCYGFNSQGHEACRPRIGAYHTNPRRKGVFGINLGKNKTSESDTADYVLGVRRLGRFADYLVINVSSPNTPGLRNLQHEKRLLELLLQVKAARDEITSECDRMIPLLVKIAPDVTDTELASIADVIVKSKVDGVIISNTTISRPPRIKEIELQETMKGGLSGEPVKELSTSVISKFYHLTRGKVPIIGVGGVQTGQDAYDKIKAGASLVQLYSSMALHGPQIVSQVKQELATLLEKDGCTSISQAIGASHRQ